MKNYCHYDDMCHCEELRSLCRAGVTVKNWGHGEYMGHCEELGSL